jgi:hypothetical protein
VLNKIYRLRPAVAIVALSVAVFASGCATTVPKAAFTQSISVESRVGAADKTSATITADPGLNLQDFDRARMQQKVENAISAKKAGNLGIADRDVLVEVKITRYEKGNAFARAMLAGLGQMHIDGKVDVYVLPERTLIGSFTLNKTFAWGGIYGAVTSMEDIEQTFAEGVAASVTGGEADKKQASPK